MAAYESIMQGVQHGIQTPYATLIQQNPYMPADVKQAALQQYEQQMQQQQAMAQQQQQGEMQMQQQKQQHDMAMQQVAMIQKQEVV
jgi:hypothetical protein